MHISQNADLHDPLLCPKCGNDFLHHADVIVYDRREDADDTRVTTIGATINVAMVPNARSGNPSSRRDGLAIEFECEGCHGQFELTIEQHKGQTYLNWRDLKCSVCGRHHNA
jgi:hypothetical protein